MSPPRTLYEKVWDRHVVVPETAETPGVMYVDLHLVHEALSILLGVAFVLVELHHDCTGEDCVICAAVALDVAYLRTEAAALPQVIFTAITLFAVVLEIVAFEQTHRQKPSPVTLKVKLSD